MIEPHNNEEFVSELEKLKEKERLDALLQRINIEDEPSQSPKQRWDESPESDKDY